MSPLWQRKDIKITGALLDTAQEVLRTTQRTTTSCVLMARRTRSTTIPTRLLRTVRILPGTKICKTPTRHLRTQNCEDISILPNTDSTASPRRLLRTARILLYYVPGTERTATPTRAFILPGTLVRSVLEAKDKIGFASTW